MQTGRTVHQIPCGPAVNSVDWNPTSNLLAYAGDDNIKGNMKSFLFHQNHSPEGKFNNCCFWFPGFFVTGIVRVFGFTSAG